MTDTAASSQREIPFSRALLPLLLITGMFFMNFFCRVLLSPLMPRIEQGLGFSHAQAGRLFLWLSAGYCLSVFGSGVVSSRLTHRRTIILSAALVGGMLFAVSSCTALWQLNMALFALGLSAGLYIPSSIATITSLVRSAHWGKAIAIHEVAPNAAFVLAPLLAGAALNLISWERAILISAGATLAVGVGFVGFGRGGRFTGEAPHLRALTTLFREKRFWFVAVLFTLGISSTLGVFNMLPLYLVSFHGEDLSYANTLIGLSRALSIGTALAAGWITDRLGPARTMRWVLLITGGCTALLGLASGPLLWVMLFVQPLFAVCFFPAGFVAVSQIGTEHSRNVAVSVVVPFGFLVGGGAVPAAIGVSGELGAFDLGIALTGVLIASGAVIAGLFGRLGKPN